MAIVSGSRPNLYISDGSETHSLKFVTYSLGQENTFSSYSNSKLTTTPNLAMETYISGETPVSLELETYFHYMISGGNLSASEKLLWDSLSATTSQEFLSNYKVKFTDSNTNKLKELTIWLELEEGVVWKFSNMVVEAAAIPLGIDKIASIKWKLSGLSIDTNATAPTNYIDKTSDNFYRNKLNLVELSQLGTVYNLPIIDGTVNINNTVNYVQRNRLGEFSRPQEHYISNRLVTGNIKTYMRTGTTEGKTNSIGLLNQLYTVDPEIGFNLNIVLNACNVEYYTIIKINSALIRLPQYETVKPLTMDFQFHARESSIGANDDIQIDYIYTVDSDILSAEVNDN